MTMDIKAVIKSQYLASLEMLHKAVVQCPDSMWDDHAYKNRFWHLAYHVLFYTHLYLAPTEEQFVPWVKHREHYPFLGALPWPPHDEPQIDQPYVREDILEYLEFCRGEVERQVTALNLDAESGFYWLPFDKLELQFYNIRHLQQHTGELCERLGTQAGIDVDWVGRG
jgi:hypothetical protein